MTMTHVTQSVVIHFTHDSSSSPVGAWELGAVRIAIRLALFSPPMYVIRRNQTIITPAATVGLVLGVNYTAFIAT